MDGQLRAAVGHLHSVHLLSSPLGVWARDGSAQPGQGPGWSAASEAARKAGRNVSQELAAVPGHGLDGAANGQAQ
jgi:hypothetical protein